MMLTIQCSKNDAPEILIHRCNENTAAEGANYYGVDT